jgi:hypothetical protein
MKLDPGIHIGMHLVCFLKPGVTGDFNLTRFIDDRSSRGADTRLMEAFNNFIERFCLKELQRGAKIYLDKQSGMSNQKQH